MEGPWLDLWSALGPLAVAAALSPLVKPVFLAYLALPADRWPERTEGIAQRLVLLVGGWMALEAHQVVLRTGDRAVLSPLPVEPAGVVAYELVRLLVQRWWLVPAIGLACIPLLFAAPDQWGALIAVLLGVQLGALFAGAVGALLAIEASENPRWFPLLDLLRGQNPRVQSALLWAPGAALAAVGSAGMVAVALRTGVAAVLPAALGVALATQIPRLARRAWFQGTPLLQEIDARYAAFERPEDARRVYLDWAVRFFPAATRTWALADLRHGWRQRRSWISAAWVGGLAAGLASWSASPGSIATTASVAAAAVWAVGAVSGWMDRDVPPFTRFVLPDRTVARHGARALVLAAWLQPMAFVPALPVLVRHGAGDALALAGLTEASILGAALLAAALGRLGIGVVGYAPTAALAAGLATAAGGRL